MTVSQADAGYAQRVFWKSPFVAWICFFLALYATVMTPLVVYNAFQGIGGSAKWIVLFIALPLRLCWIYFFFGRWIAIRKATAASRELNPEGNG